MLFRGDRLGLHEELVLLSLEDRRGVFQWKEWGAVVGGAIAAELLLHERVRLENEPGARAGSPFLELVDDEPLGCAVLDEALERVATASRRARLGEWIRRFHHRRGVHQDIARQLCARGILREDEATVLLFFRRRVFPEVNPVPERKLLERLERAVFGDVEVDDRTAILVTLADAGRLLEIPFGRDRVARRRDRIVALGQGSQVTDATRQVIEQLQAAMTLIMISAAT